MEISEFTVVELIDMLKKMPPDARLCIDYEGYYDGSGGPEKPHVDKLGRVVIGRVEANY